MTNLWYFDLRTFSQNDFDYRIERLPVSQINEINRYYFFKDRAQRLVGKLLIKRAIRETGKNVNLFNTIEKADNNKPYIKDWNFFNVSHSLDFVVLAYCDDSEIGVDIERGLSL